MDEHPWSEPENDPEEVGDDDLDSEDYSENDSDGTTSASESSDSDEDAHHNVAELQNSGKETPGENLLCCVASVRKAAKPGLLPMSVLFCLSHRSRSSCTTSSIAGDITRKNGFCTGA